MTTFKRYVCNLCRQEIGDDSCGAAVGFSNRLASARDHSSTGDNYRNVPVALLPLETRSDIDSHICRTCANEIAEMQFPESWR